jgi:hypothetical protein
MARTRLTADDVDALRRMHRAGKLTVGDVARVIDDLAGAVTQRDEAERVVHQLAERWPKDALREVEAWLAGAAERGVRIRS